jgi:predicted nucleic acid-binding protein
MNVIVDTSVWSLVLRRGFRSDHPQAIKLADLLAEKRPVALLGVILQEILQGIRDPSQFDRIRRSLEAVELLDLGRDDFVAAAELWNLCRSHGVQASSTDCLIAAACLRHDCRLLTSDQDFQQMARFCPLQLV